jgi:aldose 1-epimerase
LLKINHIQDPKQHLNLLEIANKNSKAKIHLNKGASLQELTLNGYDLIKPMHPLNYSTTYASSILFPFANRIKDGIYEFNGDRHQLDINEKELNNAIHGLVYNKTFEILNKKTTETFASVKLVYRENEKCKGFPFTYSIFLEYILTDKTLDLIIGIINTDTKTFPFTIGWHPYFLSEDLSKSSVVFDSKKKLKIDSRNITERLIVNKNDSGFNINNQFLDDCFVLDSNTVLFLTPNYSFQLSSSSKDCFLQLYTPPHKNTIAIEPTTGVSDSFNNGIGLKTLQPNKSYSISWSLKIEDN